LCKVSIKPSDKLESTCTGSISRKIISGFFSKIRFKPSTAFCTEPIKESSEKPSAIALVFNILSWSSSIITYE